jgi:REP element-mobilizing transposase RayT
MNPVTCVEAASVPPHPTDAFYTYNNRLPHWRRQGATYFVTWRVANRQPDLQPAERKVVTDVLKHFDGHRYSLFAYVVMNDHVHTVVEPAPDLQLQTIIHSWKSFSAFRLQRELNRDGAIWQKGYFNRIIRHDVEFRMVVEYVLNNPVKRWPGVEGYPWVGCGGTEAASTQVCGLDG